MFWFFPLSSCRVSLQFEVFLILELSHGYTRKYYATHTTHKCEVSVMSPSRRMTFLIRTHILLVQLPFYNIFCVDMSRIVMQCSNEHLTKEYGGYWYFHVWPEICQLRIVRTWCINRWVAASRGWRKFGVIFKFCLEKHIMISLGS